MSNDKLVGRRVVFENRKGKIVETRNAGFEARVKFEDRPRPTWMRTDDLKFDTGEDRAELSIPSPPRKIPGDPFPQNDEAEPALVARRIVEALRLGIVSDDGIDLFTVGRAEELAEIHTWLGDEAQGSRALIGNYGTGKTHLMRYVAHKAIREGWAVAQVGVNPADSPFTKPKSVYAEVVRTLRWRSNGQILGFRELMQAAMRHNLHRENTFFRALRPDSPDQVWDWIEARSAVNRPAVYLSSWERANFEPLHANMNTANIYTYLISSIATIAAHPAIGCHGLLIEFDEAESIDTRLTTNEYRRGINFVNALIATSKGDENLAIPWSNYEGQYKLETSGYSPHISFLYKAPSHLKLLFAFTEENTLNHSRWLQSIGRTFVSHLDFEERRTLQSNIIDLYMRGYALDAEQIDWTKPLPLNAKMDQLTRYFVKGTVELMDLRRRRM